MNTFSLKILTKPIIACLLCLSSSQIAFAGQNQAAPIEKKTYSVTGTLLPNFTTKIGSQMSGRVQNVYASTGDYVEKDQVLLTLDPLFFELEYKKVHTLAELAKVSYEDAELEFSRMKNLWEKQEGDKPSIPKKQYDDAESRLKQRKLLLSQAILDLEYSAKRLEETSIKAPYSGIITKRYVDSGEAVTVIPATNLFEIIDSSKLVFEFSLPQEMLGKVKPGLEVFVHLEQKKNFIQAKIEKVIQQVDPSSRSFKCRVILDNEDLSLVPGCFVTATIELN